MTLGFLDENRRRSYPLVPNAVLALRPVIVDLQLYYGTDQPFDIEQDQAVLWEVSQSGSNWLFDFRIRRGSSMISQPPLVVSVPDSAPVFSTYHLATAGNRSYVYLTIGEIDQAQAWAATTASQALAVEDRCVVAPDVQAVESLTVMNGQANQSLVDYFTYVSATDPAANYAATAALWTYDPDVYDQTVGSLANNIRLSAGVAAAVRAADGRITIGLRPTAGNRNCCFVLPDEQTARHTFRSFCGRPPAGGGQLALEVGQGITLEPDGPNNKLLIKVGVPRRDDQCLDRGVEDPAAPVIPEPPA